MYVQLDTRPIEKGCREIVYSWKSSEPESAEQCERKSIKSHPRPNLVFAQFSVVCVQLDARPIEEGLWEGRFLREGRMFVEELRT